MVDWGITMGISWENIGDIHRYSIVFHIHLGYDMVVTLAKWDTSPKCINSGCPLVPHFGMPFWGDESNSRPTEEGRKYVHEARVMFRCQRCSHVEKMRGVASHAKPIGKID